MKLFVVYCEATFNKSDRITELVGPMSFHTSYEGGMRSLEQFVEKYEEWCGFKEGECEKVVVNEGDTVCLILKYRDDKYKFYVHEETVLD